MSSSSLILTMQNDQVEAHTNNNIINHKPSSINHSHPFIHSNNSLQTKSATMTLEFEFDRITLDERNHATQTAPKTPVKSLEPYAPVSPSSSTEGSPSPSRILTPLSPVRARLQRRDESFGEIGRCADQIVMSEHKRAEMEGRFKEEPLLKDNPGRFVLFPIQDNDVSLSVVCL